MRMKKPNELFTATVTAYKIGSDIIASVTLYERPEFPVRTNYVKLEHRGNDGLEYMDGTIEPLYEYLGESVSELEEQMLKQIFEGVTE